MYFKRLDIQGFKSFADKICLEFNAGITSVVGPNGSGKSNIADAIRWVLGEQSIKTLRGGKMEDVIFAGTEHRKPLGFAEVSLTIDNSEKVLSVDYSEVTVTRRVYRSGESEFMINKTPCRLKDIHELFMDTGIGRDGYSIIGQGRVDEILSSKSEDRRHIFEEALGIMKYKIRKIEAEKKLEMTRQNLLRINDIVLEIENQLEPMLDQSETAKKYLLFREELKEIEVSLYIENITKLIEKTIEYDEIFVTCKENMDSQKMVLEDVSKQNEEKLKYLRKSEEDLELLRRTHHELESKEQEICSKTKVNEEKNAGLSKEISRIDNDIADINQKIEVLKKEEHSKKAELNKVEYEYGEVSAKLSNLDKESVAANEVLVEKEKVLEQMNKALMDKIENQSDKKMQVNNIKNFIDGIKQRQTVLENQLRDCFLERDAETGKKNELSICLAQTKEQIQKNIHKISELNLKKQQFEQSLVEERKKQNIVISEFQLKASRLKVLSDMENNLEGYYRSVKQILKECSASAEFGKGIYGALAKLISVEKKYELAIETALGSTLQNIVTNTENDAKRAIEYLKNNKLGRATFLPISSIKGKYLDDTLYNRVKKHKGFCSVASDLVGSNDDVKGIVLNLLGRVVIAEDLNFGISMAREFGYGFKIVTLEGDVLNAGGSMTGGSSENKDVGLLSRNREILELKSSLDTLSQNKIKLEKNVNQMIEDINEITKNISLEERTLKDTEIKNVRNESILGQITETLKKCEGKIEVFEFEKAELMGQLSESLSEHDDNSTELEGMGNEIAELKKDILDYQEKFKGEQTSRERLQKELTEIKINTERLKKSIESGKENITRISLEIEVSNKLLSKLTAEVLMCNESINGLKSEDLNLKVLIDDYSKQKQNLTLKIDELIDQRKLIEAESSGILNRINDTNKNILLLQEELSRIEVKKARAESDVEAIKTRMWDEYELTYTNSLKYKKDIESISASQKRINELKNEIRELGVVNVSAIEEYKKLKERYEFLSSQKNDMESACEKLRKVINEMVLIMKRQFLERFELINKNFGEVFKELFNGGRAELILADKENVLETDIEIQVQPPGKKLQNMMLLSGGERAFTAIALLFSIIRLHPTPFCVLDEIEAALDDANVYRFAEYLKAHVHLTQFIMITHRKGTMEASDALYGVTMQEHGVSKVVSMKLGEKAS